MSSLDGRVQRRIDGMRRVQAAALDLFEESGFSAVTVEQIAERAAVGPASVYRYFASKERIVLWDEYDPMLLEGIARALPRRPRLDAILIGLREALDEVYARDRKRILRRARLVLSEPSIASAARADQVALRGALARLLGADLAANVAAAATVATLETAVVEWVRGRGRISFGEILDQAFGELRAFAG